MANVSNVGFGVAIVGGAVGLVGLLTRPSGASSKSASATPFVTPTGAGLQGRF